MTCGCSDKLNNKKLENMQSELNNKILSLESIKELSIDDIINLYRQGYRLETQEEYNIESLQYSSNCGGTITIDKQNTELSPPYYPMYRSSAVAQKFKPTSRCLTDISLWIVNNGSENAYFEIRRDSGGVPDGLPKSGNALGIFGVSNSDMTGLVTKTVNILLNDNDLTNGIWIVVSPFIYDPNNTDIMNTLFYVYSGPSSNSGEVLAYRDGQNPSWTTYGGHIYFKSTKQSYNPPVLTTIDITPTSAEVAVGSTQQFTAFPKDQYGNPISATITWSSTNTSRGTVNPTTGTITTFTGLSAGSVAVRAESGSVSRDAGVTVTSSSGTPALSSVVVSPSTANVAIGATRQFTAYPKDQYGNPISASISWQNSNPAKGTIDPTTGVSTTLTGVSEGSTTLTAVATSGSISKSGLSIVTISAQGEGGAGAGIAMLLGLVGIVAVGMMVTAPKPKYPSEK